ncbi:MAG: DUF2891 domain-containing protein [Chloroflexota bacterium]
MNKKEYPTLIERLGYQTIQIIHKEYPNGMQLTLPSPNSQIICPKKIHPAFYGCYDWHSAVHSHWQLVKIMKMLPCGVLHERAVEAIDKNLTVENIEIELNWLKGRKNFEMPYGMAWLLLLCAELRMWEKPHAKRWLYVLSPLEEHAQERFLQYCEQMPLPNRGGLHNQSAFSLGLVFDYAEICGDEELLGAVSSMARRFYWADINVNLNYEPSAADFLSPSLSEADLMGRILNEDEFEIWLDLFAPDGFDLLQPVEVVDPSNGQLAHWAGLNLSRSWMLSNIADSLPADHPIIPSLHLLSAKHLEIGLPMATHSDYMISHWVPTFAIYLLDVQEKAQLKQPQ